MTDEPTHINQFELEDRELKYESEILNWAASFFGQAQPTTPELARFINKNNDDIVIGRRLGVQTPDR